MKRFDIRDKQSGQITHSYEAEQATGHQPEWGLKERIVPEKQASDKEKATAIEVIEEPSQYEGIPPTRYLKLPQTYEVVETDITDEFELRERNIRVALLMPSGAEVYEAIFEKFAENRPEKFDQLQARRVAIKAANPKPQPKGHQQGGSGV